MKKVILALSGGVDSSYAAWLLREQGYDVEGLCLDLFAGSGAPAAALETGKKLGIKVTVKQLHQVFQQEVRDYFLRTYAAGQTPNPCVVCNPAIKFAALLQEAEERGAEHIATGHYAGCRYDRETKQYLLLRGRDEKKDQSYFLYRLGQDILQSVLFPLGGMTKAEVRKGAATAGLPSAENRDSQELCFIPDGDYRRFLYGAEAEDIPGLASAFTDGDFIDESGTVLGKHRGVAWYTIGQRKNLGLALGVPLYVLEIRAHSNQVVLGKEDALYKREIPTEDNHFINGKQAEEAMEVSVKLRSGAVPAKAVFTPLPEGKGRLIFEKPQRAAAPGQSAVYYAGCRLLGGGIIQA